MRGKYLPSDEVDPESNNKITRDCLFSKKERSKIQPNEDCLNMYCLSNSDASKIKKKLLKLGREPNPINYTGNSLYEAVLKQISHNRYMYTPILLRKQTAFYMAKWPEKLYPIYRDYIKDTDETYESRLWNIYNGRVIGDELEMSAISLMFGLSITVVTPQRTVRVFHQCDTPDVVLVCNEQTGLNKHYTATKGITDGWKPVTPKNYSQEVKTVSNSSLSLEQAKGHWHEYKSKELIEQYGLLSKKMEKSVAEVELFEDQLLEMIKFRDRARENITAIENKLALLRGQLLCLGMDVQEFSSRRVIRKPPIIDIESAQGESTERENITNILQHFQHRRHSENQAAVEALYQGNIRLSSSAGNKVNVTPVATQSVNPNDATQSIPPSVATESIDATGNANTTTDDNIPLVKVNESDSSSSGEDNEIPPGMVSADDQDTFMQYLVGGGVGREEQGHKSPDSIEDITPTDTTAAALPVHPSQQAFNPVVIPGQVMTPAPPGSIPSLNAPGNPQVIIQGGVRNISMRWGRFLKGVYKYFCPKCNAPFTQKSDQSRHLRSHCPFRDKTSDKKFSCSVCGKENSTEQYLKDHIADKHTGELRYSCGFCTTRFTTNQKAVNHRKSCEFRFAAQ